MSTVNGVNQASASNASSITSAAQKEVNTEDFLKLLVAQLQNQDPTNPMDNQDFLGQLATFNSLGQLVEINKSMSTLAGASDTNSKSLEQLELINKNLGKLVEANKSSES